VYSTIRDNGGWDNWEMIEIEKYNCNDSNEATARERHWYETLQAKLNMIYPNRTHKEYYKEYCFNNRNKELLRKKQYRDNNKEKRYQKCTCEICGKDYTHNHKSRHEKTIFHLSKLEKTN
jgi:alpha-galactosidase/6-phospho-beta-glucosidase family protein